MFATTHVDENIRFTELSFYYHFMGQLTEQSLLSSLKSTIELARKLQGRQLCFNPNLISLNLGGFNGEAAFENEVGSIGSGLQNRLYGGGSIGYTQASNDFILYLGLEQEIGQKQGVMEVKKIELEGTAQPANSLDELLARI